MEIPKIIVARKILVDFLVLDWISNTHFEHKYQEFHDILLNVLASLNIFSEQHLKPMHFLFNI